MASKMKAAVCTQYGGPEVVQIREVDIPAPKNNEIRIKIRATAVNSADYRLRKPDPFAVRFFFGLFKPKKPILGGVLSGTVDAVGRDVQKFKVGDAVFGATQMHLGAHAEYVCLPENGALILKPDAVSHEEAAALPFGGITALHYLRKTTIQPGYKVLVYGASGAVGTAAVQLAKYFGAEVTGVCSTANVALVKSLGADHVIDYTKADFGQNTGLYDIVFETVNKAPLASCLAVMKPTGTLILGAALPAEMLRGALATLFSKKKLIVGVSEETPETVAFLGKLAANGQFKAVIDKIYDLEQIREAHAYVEGGHKRGNVLICSIRSSDEQ